jgi:formylglycine-generating enzyme required for sulfatase activity
MVLIPAGTFMMGSLDSEKKYDQYSNEGPQHKVTISKDFYMGKYEVTQAQWQAVMGNNPSFFSGNPNNPVEGVSWNDCQPFIQKLNRMGQGTFRLPTEAEWEYAGRAGTTTWFYWGDDPNYIQISQYAWYTDNSGVGTHEVGLKLPNAWGLFDMSGNVWEWCQDWYGSYSSNDQVDPICSTIWLARVIRGGGWMDPAGNCRSALRSNSRPDSPCDSIGFRLVAFRTQ